jgi:hypothetical protein
MGPGLDGSTLIPYSTKVKRNQPMARSFCPASDLETRQTVWSCFNNCQQMNQNNHPVVLSAAAIANHFATRYA